MGKDWQGLSYTKTSSETRPGSLFNWLERKQKKEMTWQFTYDNLRNYFRFLKEIGRVTSFSNMNLGSIVLRHDVDLDLQPAYQLALLEEEEEIKSTFFVRVTSQTYNIFSQKSRVILHKMYSLGFEIGLHFDPSIYPPSDWAIKVDFEKKILGSAMYGDYQVKSISLHNPSLCLSRPITGKLIDAYDSAVWSDTNYISDSCMQFRGKDPYAFVKNASMPIQILLHPFHYAERRETYLEKMGRYFYNQVKYIGEKYQDNPTFVKDMENKELVSLLLKGD
jgi:hypothetical protein